MESIRSKFFNGVDSSDRKISWVAWDNVLASKLNGGLGVSSFFALNRALLLKWVWRFISGDGSLWCNSNQAIYAQRVCSTCDRSTLNLVLYLREVKSLKDPVLIFLLIFPFIWLSKLDNEIEVLIKWELFGFSFFSPGLADGAGRKPWIPSSKYDLVVLHVISTLSERESKKRIMGDFEPPSFDLGCSNSKWCMGWIKD
ncbi:hypothetical protein Tco_0508955, partial [Tanacetum coccineum]